MHMAHLRSLLALLLAHHQYLAAASTSAGTGPVPVTMHACNVMTEAVSYERTPGAEKQDSQLLRNTEIDVFW